MRIELYKATLRTGSKTENEIISDFEGDVAEKEIEEWLKAYNLIDGKEVVVADIREDRYTLVAWVDKDVEAYRDFVYQIEQDDMYGMYINERAEFLKDWEDGAYEPSGSLLFNKTDIEIIEKITLSSTV